jgi:hypothetical protein
VATVVRFPQVRTLRSKLYGVSFRNADGSRRQHFIRHCKHGDPIVLVRERTNAHDPFAVAVRTQQGQKIGYLGAHLAETISREIAEGRRVSAAIMNVTGGGGWLFLKRNYGVNIEIKIE